jgi:hypothetical protein
VPPLYTSGEQTSTTAPAHHPCSKQKFFKTKLGADDELRLCDKFINRPCISIIMTLKIIRINAKNISLNDNSNNNNNDNRDC